MAINNSRRYVWQDKGIPVHSYVRHDQAQIHLDQVLHNALFDKKLEYFTTQYSCINALINTWNSVEFGDNNESTPNFSSNPEYYNVLNFLIDRNHPELLSDSTRDLSSEINDFLGTLQYDLKRIHKLIQFTGQSRQSFELKELNQALTEVVENIQSKYQTDFTETIASLKKTREACKAWLKKTKNIPDNDEFESKTFNSADMRRTHLLAKSNLSFKHLFHILRQDKHLKLSEKRTQVMALITGITNHISNIQGLEKFLKKSNLELEKTLESSKEQCEKFESVITQIQNGHNISQDEATIVQTALKGKLFFNQSNKDITVSAFETKNHPDPDFHHAYSKYSGDNLTQAEWDRYSKLVYQEELDMPPEEVLKNINQEGILSYLWRRLSRLLSPVSSELIKTRIECYDRILEHFGNNAACNNYEAIPIAAHQLANLPIDQEVERNEKISAILDRLKISRGL